MHCLVAYTVIIIVYSYWLPNMKQGGLCAYLALLLLAGVSASEFYRGIEHVAERCYTCGDALACEDLAVHE